MATNNRNILKRLWLPVALLAVVIINMIASQAHARLDLTSEKRFTLSKPVKAMLTSLDTTISIEVFLKGDYPSGFRKLSSSSNDLLREFRELAGNKLQFNFISPEELVPGTDTRYADTLTAMGMVPINLTSQVKQGQQQQYVYPFALVHRGERTVPVRLYQGKTPLISFQELNSAEALLEYNFAEAISKVNSNTRPVVGYLTGNGEPSQMNTYDLVQNTLIPDYQLFTLNPNTQPGVPATFDALLVVKPTEPFSEEAKLKLDQYVMHGGKIIWFIDRLNAEMDSLQVKNEVVAYDRDLKINDLLFRYGVRINPDLVMDLQCDYLPFDVNGDGQFQLLPWNYFPVFESPENHAINKNLGFVSGRFVNSIDTVEAEGIRKTILLQSSVNARKIGSPALISGKENSNAPEDEKFVTPHIPVAVLLEGTFRSLYANRLSAAQRDSLSANDEQFVQANVAPNKMIVVADGDMVLNSITKGNQPIPMGMNPYTYGSQREFPFANKEFLQNCLNYLVNKNDLGEAKSKDYVVRLLDTKKVEQDKRFWQIINIVVPCIFIIILALLFSWWRKRKYSRPLA